MFRKAVVVITIRVLPNGQSEQYEKHLYSGREFQRWQFACMQAGLPIPGMGETWVWEEPIK